MILTIDIETIPTQCPVLAAHVASMVQPPATLKKPETIAKWWAEEAEEAKRVAIEKTAFDGAFGELACVSIAVDDGLPVTWVRDHNSSEANMLVSLADMLHDVIDRTPRIVGFNHVNFDLPFLWKRAIKHGVFLPRMPRYVKPWDRDVFDVMTNWDSKNYIKLGELAKALGIESDNEYTGADVWPMYQQGRYDEIGRYCADDVVLTRAIYKRMIFGSAA